jgi:hypothetical protein
MTKRICYTDEWKRSNPDFVVYLPKQVIGPDTDNSCLLVTETPGRYLLAFWTQATYEGADNTCVVCARSSDGGVNWTEPMEIDGPTDGRFRIALAGFPVVARSGRIYCFYRKRVRVADLNNFYTGPVRCRYSDDEGCSWAEPVEIPFGLREGVDHPDPGIPPSWEPWCKPIRDSKGRWLEPFSHWPSGPDPPTGNACMEMMRFDNIDEGPDPKDLQITWLPEEPVKPAEGLALRGLFEPCIVLLPNGWLFMVMRSLTGYVWYSVSEDDGASWRPAEPLRYKDNGERVLHPGSPPPLYALQDGRFLLQHHNNDGSMGYGIGLGDGKWTKPNTLNRRSMFLSVGEFRSQARQPIWFSPPKKLADSDGTPAGVQFRTEMGTYSSLTEHREQRVIWYPDRKHFLLGKLVSDEWLADMQAPTDD